MGRVLRLIYSELDERDRPTLKAFVDLDTSEVLIREYDQHPFGLSAVTTQTTLSAGLVSAIKALP